jgi:CCR4-NOT transcriptional complex subunit CAF120
VPDSEPTPHEENSDDGTRGELVGQHTSPGPSHEQQTSAEDSDLLAAISYMNSTEPVAETNIKSPAQVDNTYTMHPVETPQAMPPPESPDGASQFKSSFAPSKQAEERKARSQAQQAAHNAAVHKPGRSNGKGKMKSTGAWGESSEEEEEEEEEDDDVDSDVEPLPVGNPQNPTPQDPDLQNRSTRPPPPPPPPLPPLRPPPPRRSLSPTSPAETSINPSTGRPVRHLPQIPTGKSPGMVYM